MKIRKRQLKFFRGSQNAQNWLSLGRKTPIYNQRVRNENIRVVFKQKPLNASLYFVKDQNRIHYQATVCKQLFFKAKWKKITYP